MLRPPQIRIFSPALTLIGEVPGCTSALYTRRWQSPGDFEISVPLGASGADLLRPGNIIMLDADGRRSGVILSVEISESASGVLAARGASLSGLCAYRVTVPPDGAANMGYDNVPLVAVPGVYPEPVSAETVLKEYAYRHMKRDADRNFPLLDIAPDQQRGVSIRWMSRFENLAEVLCGVCEYCDIGYEIRLDAAGKRMIFDVVEGVSRLNGPARVIFSSKLANVKGLAYAFSLDGYRNLAYVGGAGEDENRLIQTVWGDEKPIGTERREVFIDAGTLEIADGLTDEGRRKLRDYPTAKSISCEILDSGPFKYRADWDLGDIVTIQSAGAGVTFDTRITEVTERYDSQAMEIIPVFGTPQERFGRMIKRLESRQKVR